jgi:hypothetical protein
MVMIGNMTLVSGSESIDTVSISNALKLSASDCSRSSKSVLQDCRKRPAACAHMSLLVVMSRVLSMNCVFQQIMNHHFIEMFLIIRNTPNSLSMLM